MMLMIILTIEMQVMVNRIKVIMAMEMEYGNADGSDYSAE